MSAKLSISLCQGKWKENVLEVINVGLSRFPMT